MSRVRSVGTLIAICLASTALACANKNGSAPNETGTEFSSAPQNGAAPNAAAWSKSLHPCGRDRVARGVSAPWYQKKTAARP